ncbi:hypothetical protein QN277_008001 [Acacia crassicarpa]|uniref:LTI65/LTI78 PGEED repeat domain-containing protein n=1 Tax=Acacia crassicarpa TaxID=499986 RepID=A0AAE1JKS6_9FABA|nr:hypothetical protein QN277_008001 [Acacia crassicarpa]
MAQLHRHDPADTSKSHVSTVEQLFREAEASKDKGSPSDRSKRCESVLAKVKEKAKKLRHTLSKKKHDDNVIPYPVEDDDVDQDTEYLGAPMYESELAPEQYKEKARQRPRANAMSEKHVQPSFVKSRVQGDKEASPSPSKSNKIAAHNSAGPSKTTPDSALTHSVPSKFSGLSVEPPERASSSAPTTSRKVSSPKTPKAKTASKTLHDASNMPPHALSAPATPYGYRDQIWDKGISVKEYLMNKFEPGEDDRALSQVISEAISPRKPPGDKGVVEKFRDAVTSLLRNDEPSQSLVAQTSPEIPVSTNAYEVGQEEAHGRILQAN